MEWFTPYGFDEKLLKTNWVITEIIKMVPAIKLSF